MRWHFTTGKPAKPSVGGHLFEPLSQDAIRDEYLFDFENARENQRNSIALWATTAKSLFNHGADRLNIDAEKVANQIIFTIGKICCSTGDRPKGDLDFSHSGTSQAGQ
jgi:hypothetical protein